MVDYECIRCPDRESILPVVEFVRARAEALFGNCVDRVRHRSLEGSNGRLVGDVL